ncbi:MAG: hypothetical protein HN790_08745 [Methylococcales bacterium]|jgi:hypothetical protein|nr:hypothetical protein [Methylococcales bacterium]
MRELKKILLSMLVLSVFWPAAFAFNDQQSHYDVIAKNDFIELAEETLAWRARAIAFYQSLEQDKVYSSDVLAGLHERGSARYKAIRNRLLNVVEHYKWVTDRSTKIEFTHLPTAIFEKKKWRTDITAWSDFECLLCRDKQKTIRVNPSDALGQSYIAQFKMALAATLLLYDNYLHAISQYESLSKARRLLNQDSKDYKGYLAELTENFQDLDNMKRTTRAVVIHEQLTQWLEVQHIGAPEDVQYFSELINQSYTYQHITDVKTHQVVLANVGRLTKSLVDFLASFKESVTNDVSKVFGNSIGLIETRKGKLYQMPEGELNGLVGQLKPLDILLEKTPFRATDKFIPGHWGHVAIWSGNEQELKQLGLWDDPLIKPYQLQIRQGKRVIEALREGVVLNTLQHFLNIDDLAILRYKGKLARSKRLLYVKNAFKQLGKAYDFNFDVESDLKIVCSELAYVTYSDIEWPTEGALGRETISPDNVAKLALGQRKLFEPIVLYHDGKAVERVHEAFTRLVE